MKAFDEKDIWASIFSKMSKEIILAAYFIISLYIDYHDLKLIKNYPHCFKYLRKVLFLILPIKCSNKLMILTMKPLNLFRLGILKSYLFRRSLLYAAIKPYFLGEIMLFELVTIFKHLYILLHFSFVNCRVTFSLVWISRRISRRAWEFWGEKRYGHLRMLNLCEKLSKCLGWNMLK